MALSPEPILFGNFYFMGNCCHAHEAIRLIFEAISLALGKIPKGTVWENRIYLANSGWPSL